MTDDTIHITDRQRDRIESIKDRLQEREHYIPGPSDKVVLRYLLDTAKGVRRGLYVIGSDPYVSAALSAGRPVEPCECGCGCDLHTYPDDDRCVWCRNDQHSGGDGYE